MIRLFQSPKFSTVLRGYCACALNKQPKITLDLPLLRLVSSSSSCAQGVFFATEGENWPQSPGHETCNYTPLQQAPAVQHFRQDFSYQSQTNRNAKGNNRPNYFNRRPPTTLPFGGHEDRDRVSKLENILHRSNYGDWQNQAPRDQALEQELFQKSHSSGGNFDSYSNVTTSVEGHNIPPPVQQFYQLNLHPFLADNVALSGYDSLTPVQKHAIPVSLAMRDMMVCAQTGSGKTAAFLLPIIHRILSFGYNDASANAHDFGKRWPLALILAPTRELCRQIFAEAVKLTYRTPIRPVLLHGGAENRRSQIEFLRSGCHIVIGTPGRVGDMLFSEYIGLRMCGQLILDEGDRMLDMGFEQQLNSIITGFDLPWGGQRQTLMYSATFPKEIRFMAHKYLKQDHIFLEIGKTGTTCDTIVQQILLVPETKVQRGEKIVEVLSNASTDPKDRTLIFVKRKSDVDDLSQFLRVRGYSCTEMHGDLTQRRREQNLDAFRSGTANILIATDVAARGLDISNVRHVVNFYMPGNIDDYIHRIGRTGRLGQTGLATSFFTEADSGIAKDLIQVLQAAKQPVPSFLQQCSQLTKRDRSQFRRQNRPPQQSFQRRFNNQIGMGMGGSHYARRPPGAI